MISIGTNVVEADHRPNSRRIVTSIVLGAFFLVGARPAIAHEGPPFPILMDQPAADYLVSVWADPDIGEATFFVIIESKDGGPPESVPSVEMWVEPVDGRLDRVSLAATRQHLRRRVQFRAQPHFDRRDFWLVGFNVSSPSGANGLLTAEVESTPPGYGLWDLVIYLFPFVFLGVMWWRAMRRRAKLVRLQHRGGDSVASRPASTTVGQQGVLT